jgi:hypothetical protein
MPQAGLADTRKTLDRIDVDNAIPNNVREDMVEETNA